MIIEAPAKFGEPGWRVTRTDRRLGYPDVPADKRWLATAFYSGYVPCAPGTPQPPYCHQAEGSTDSQARSRVMALCRADTLWPLIHGDTDPIDLFSYSMSATSGRSG